MEKTIIDNINLVNKAIKTVDKIEKSIVRFNNIKKEILSLDKKLCKYESIGDVVKSELYRMQIINYMDLCNIIQDEIILNCEFICNILYTDMDVDTFIYEQFKYNIVDCGCVGTFLDA